MIKNVEEKTIKKKGRKEDKENKKDIEDKKIKR